MLRPPRYEITDQSMVLSPSLPSGCCLNTAPPLQSLPLQVSSPQYPGSTPAFSGPFKPETVRRSFTAAEIVFYVKFKNQNKP